MVLGGEKLTATSNWQGPNTCVVLWDGAGAAILQRRPVAGGILSTFLRSDGTYTDILNVPGGGSRAPATAEVVHKKLNTIHMDGREVFKLAVLKKIQAAPQALKRAHKKESDLALLISHQANLRIIEAIAERGEV